MDKITHKNKDDIYSTYRAVKTMERILKYRKRGFELTNINTFMKAIYTMLEQ
jgi:hypothetical protein